MDVNNPHNSTQFNTILHHFDFSRHVVPRGIVQILCKPANHLCKPFSLLHYIEHPYYIRSLIPLYIYERKRSISDCKADPTYTHDRTAGPLGQWLTAGPVWLYAISVLSNVNSHHADHLCNRMVSLLSLVNRYISLDLYPNLCGVW